MVIRMNDIEREEILTQLKENGALGYVIRIDEPDFGCEGRNEGETVCSKVTILTVDGEMVIDIPERVIWNTGLDEKMFISIECTNE